MLENNVKITVYCSLITELTKNGVDYEQCTIIR